jgi:putative AdoMet-dependent methyltransferase
MQRKHTAESFDEVASSYDRLVFGCVGFPYEGYDSVLDQVVSEAAVEEGMAVLDLGCGTGNLARRFADSGCLVWGLDFSRSMLTEARAKLPGATLIHADMLGDWPAIDREFDRVVSSYAFHHFDLLNKVTLLQRLADELLTGGGVIVIADIAFATTAELDEARSRFREVWDGSEYYWAADTAIEAITRSGFRCRYKQVSSCGGVFTIARA